MDRAAAARYQINVADVQDAIQTAAGGNALTQVLQGERRYDLVMRYLPAYRDTKEAIEKVRLLAPSGERVSLAQLCKVETKDGAAQIYREGNRRYIAVKYSVRGRDLGSTVEEAIEKVNKQVKIPPGYIINWMGEYESQKRAEKRLLIIVPLTIFLIFIIIYAAFGSAKWACLNLVNVAVARIGGLSRAPRDGHPFQRLVRGGVPRPFRVSVQTGVIMVEYINQLRARGYSVERSRHRRGDTATPSHHDDHAGGYAGPAACRHVSRHRLGFAAALRHRHRRRAYHRPSLEHLPAAHVLCLVGAAYGPSARGRGDNGRSACGE